MQKHPVRPKLKENFLWENIQDFKTDVKTGSVAEAGALGRKKTTLASKFQQESQNKITIQLSSCRKGRISEISLSGVVNLGIGGDASAQAL
jgi:hypothetical protein